MLRNIFLAVLLMIGMGCSHIPKQELFEYLDAHLSVARGEYERLVADPGHVEAVLQQGAERAPPLPKPVFVSSARRFASSTGPWPACETSGARR